MKEVYMQAYQLLTKCLSECHFELPSNKYVLYSTFFKNKTCGIILAGNEDKETNFNEFKKEFKKQGDFVYKTLKAMIKNKKLDKYLIITKIPYIDNISTYNEISKIYSYNFLYSIDISLGNIDDAFLGYLKLMEN